MGNPSRRIFLGASVSGLASYLVSAQEPQKKDPEAKREPSSSKVVKEDFAFQPDTLFLTWAKDPTTTMVVQWIGTRGETSDTNVYYTDERIEPIDPRNPLAKLPKVNWLSQETKALPYPMTDFKVFRAELTNLKPGTAYSFKIGKSSPTYKFSTMPSKATDALTFVSGGDCGINPAAVANNRMAAKQDPAFAIIGGDLGYDNGRSVEVSLSFIRNYSKTMITKDGRLIPMITCIGNHEVNGSYNQPREKAPFYYALFDGLFPETGYSTLDFGDYLSLVLLDTGHTSKIDGDQTTWLEKVLRARIDHPNLFVVNHVPCYPSFRNPKGRPAKEDGKGGSVGTGELQRKHWVPLFEQMRVPLVLEHHDHTFKRTKKMIGEASNDNGVLYLGDGSWGRIRIPKTPEQYPYLAKVSEDYHLTLHRIEGEERFHVAMDEQGRIMDVSRTGQRLKKLVSPRG